MTPSVLFLWIYFHVKSGGCLVYTHLRAPCLSASLSLPHRASSNTSIHVTDGLQPKLKDREQKPDLASKSIMLAEQRKLRSASILRMRTAFKRWTSPAGLWSPTFETQAEHLGCRHDHFLKSGKPRTRHTCMVFINKLTWPKWYPALVIVFTLLCTIICIKHDEDHKINR